REHEIKESFGKGFCSARGFRKFLLKLRDRVTAEADAFLRIEEGSLVNHPGDSAHTLINLRELYFADLFGAVFFEEIFDLGIELISLGLEQVLQFFHVSRLSESE